MIIGHRVERYPLHPGVHLTCRAELVRWVYRWEHMSDETRGQAEANTRAFLRYLREVHERRLRLGFDE